MRDSEYLIHKRPVNALIIFALPMMLGNLFQQFYTMADSVIVGRFIGEKALAAVGASYALTTVFISIAIGGGIGASVVASRAFGARRYGVMKSAISTSLIAFLVLSIVLGIFGYILSPAIMSALNTPDDILQDSITYLKYTSWAFRSSSCTTCSHQCSTLLGNQEFRCFSLSSHRY